MLTSKQKGKINEYKFRDIYLRNGEKQMHKYSVARLTLTAAVSTSR